MDEQQPDVPQVLEPLVTRVLANNPSPFTHTGTQTHLVGTTDLAVIDPGPDDAEHINALLAAIAGRPVAAIVITHTLRGARDQSLVHRRACNGLVDHDRLAARRRHGGVCRQPDQAPEPRRPNLLPRARRPGDSPATAGARADRASQAARGPDIAPARRRAAHDSGDGRQDVCWDRPAPVSRRGAIGTRAFDRAAGAWGGRRKRGNVAADELISPLVASATI